MDIASKLIDAEILYIQSTGKNPSSIYLGKEEYNQLTTWANKSCYFVGDLKGGSESFNGLTIRKVIEDSHLNFS